MARRSHRLAGLFCALGVLSGAPSAAAEMVWGVNHVHLGWLEPFARQEAIDRMAAAGVRSVRLDLVPPHEATLDALERLARRGIRAALVISLAEPELVAADATARPGRGVIHTVAGLSQLDPAHFRAAFGTLLATIERRGIQLAAFELGNEINWAAFNGDLALLAPGGAPHPAAPRIAALARPDLYREGLGRYVAALRVLRRLRDASSLNRTTPILSAGLAEMPVAFAAKVGAEFVDGAETLDELRRFGLDAAIDGYGVHAYPERDTDAAGRARDFARATALCRRDKPCWITEWGVAETADACPMDDSRRLPLIAEALQRMAQVAAEDRLAGAYYYDWEAEKPYAIWRCGGLTASGRLVLGTHR